jgi:hypothetical protein
MIKKRSMKAKRPAGCQNLHHRILRLRLGIKIKPR